MSQKTILAIRAREQAKRQPAPVPKGKAKKAEAIVEPIVEEAAPA